MKTIAIDFDGVICKKQPYGDGKIFETPLENASATINKLKSKGGYRIVIFTTRLNPGFGGDLDAKKQEIASWCCSNSIPFDEITNNKPPAMAYIDDRGIRFTNWHDIGNYFLN